MVYLKCVIGGSSLSLSDSNDDRVVVSGIIDSISLSCGNKRVEFNPHVNREIQLIFYGKNLTPIVYDKTKVDVVGDFDKFRLCDSESCEEYLLLISLYLNKTGKPNEIDQMESNFATPLWLDYFPVR